MQHREKLWSLSDLLTELPCTGIGVFHFWGSIPLYGKQWRSQGDVQDQLLLDALRGVWKSLKKLKRVFK
jgi:hypothetical protein